MVWNMVVWSAVFLGTAGTNGIIKQSPEQLTLTEGGTAQLNCSYISKINDAKKPVGAITWYKDEEHRVVSNKSSGFHGRVRTSSVFNILHQTVQIFNVRMNDTGKYYCRVEIFGQGDHFGKGAQVTVTPRNPTGFGRSLRWQLTEMGVKLAVFALINIVTVFGICTWGSYRALIATNRANRVIYWAPTTSGDHGNLRTRTTDVHNVSEQADRVSTSFSPSPPRTPVTQTAPLGMASPPESATPSPRQPYVPEPEPGPGT
ncbi:natural cytotoxicity triggering receptor 3-like [Hemitrygon akajei]|uniref:natural cytotoxicity triggering receptor 3-like n=1 Tax=Hemitrygon akajei TaxID=2704970 RepID=UPI003BF95721